MIIIDEWVKLEAQVEKTGKMNHIVYGPHAGPEV